MNFLGDLILYLCTLAIAAIIPGPGMIGIMYKTIAAGRSQSFLMLLGLITGDFIFLSCSILGLQNLFALSTHDFSSVMNLIGCSYLIYLSYLIWNSSKNSIKLDHHAAPQNNLLNGEQLLHSFTSFREGLFITITNPKTIIFYLVLLPAVFNLEYANTEHFLPIIYLSTFAILFLIGFIYISLTTRFMLFFNSESFVKFFTRSLALVLFLIALTMLFSFN